MDLDAEVDNNLTENYTAVEQANTQAVIFHAVSTALSFLSLIVFIIISATIIRYSKLREDRKNIIILNFCIVGCVSVLLTVFRFILLQLSLEGVVINIFCFANEIELNLGIIQMLQMIFLTLYWFTELYNPKFFVNINYFFRILSVVIYVVGLFNFSVFAKSCVDFRFANFTLLVIIGIFILQAIFQTVINIIHLVKKRHSRSIKYNTALYITNAFVYSALPMLFGGFLVMFGVHYYVFMVIAYLMAFISPILTVVILYYYDQNFGIFLRQLFWKCSNYRNENLDETPVQFVNNAVTDLS